MFYERIVNNDQENNNNNNGIIRDINQITNCKESKIKNKNYDIKKIKKVSCDDLSINIIKKKIKREIENIPKTNITKTSKSTIIPKQSKVKRQFQLD